MARPGISKGTSKQGRAEQGMAWPKVGTTCSMDEVEKGPTFAKTCQKTVARPGQFFCGPRSRF